MLWLNGQITSTFQICPPPNIFQSMAKRFLEAELKDMAYWHALPRGWEDMSYEGFLAARRAEMARVIRDGFNKLSQAPD